MVQKLWPVAFHLMEPLRLHLDELLVADFIESPLSSKDAVGWVSNILIISKKWDPTKIRLKLDTRQMNEIMKQTHYPIPTAEELRHQFSTTVCI